MSDWVEDIRLGVVDWVMNPDLSVVFELLWRDIWRLPYCASLRVVNDDDQQVGIAGRELFEDLPLRSRSLAFGFHLTRKHVMSIASGCPSVGTLARQFCSKTPTSWGRTRVLIQQRRTVSNILCGSCIPLIVAFRQGPAKERTQEGMLFPPDGVTRMLTRP